MLTPDSILRVTTTLGILAHWPLLLQARRIASSEAVLAAIDKKTKRSSFRRFVSRPGLASGVAEKKRVNSTSRIGKSKGGLILASKVIARNRSDSLVVDNVAVPTAQNLF